MIRSDQHVTVAPADIVFRVAADVERWPEILPHYRWVRFDDRRGFGRGVVEMAAWRDFIGPLRWPTWWKSRMEADPTEPVIRYQHIGGITTGMDVEWLFLPAAEGTVVRIVHAWDGPAWPLISGIAADRVIGPHFVSYIAQRTLKGVCAEAERIATLEAGSGDATAGSTTGSISGETAREATDLGTSEGTPNA